MVGFLNPFDSVDNTKNNEDAQASITAQNKFALTSTPQQAAAAAKIYSQAPWIPARVILDLAKQQNISQQAIDTIAGVAGKQVPAEYPVNPPEQKSWFERNVYSKAKTASRWAFAALQFTPDLAQNAASQVFSNNDPAGVDGWFASTQLGTLASGADAGSGLFFGGEAQKTQAQKAREFRGTINNHAWTIGRGAADIIFTPGSREYSLLSGFIDGSVNIFADPTLYVGQAFKAAKSGEAVKGLIGTKTVSQALANQMVKGGLVTDVIPKISKEAAEAAAKIARGEAGLTSAESVSFLESPFFSWFDRNNSAQRMAQRLAGHAAKATERIAANPLLTAEEQLIERGKAAAKIMADFPEGSIDPETAMLLASADDSLKVKATLGGASSLATSPESMLLPKQIGDIRGVGATAAVREYARERVPGYRTLRNSSWFTQIPTDSVLLNSTGIDRSKTVASFGKYLQGMKIHTASPTVYEDFMGKAVSTMAIKSQSQRKIAFDNLYNEFLGVITDNIGGSKNVTNEAYKLAQKELVKMRSYATDAAGNLNDGGAFKMMQEYLPQDQIDRLLESYTPQQLDNLQFQDASALTQLIDSMHVMPDFRKFRALSTNAFLNKPGVRRGLRNKSGESRQVLAAAEQLQQEVWKPVVLATGGFIVRNMIDSHIRIAASGYQGFFSHPFQFMQIAMGKRFIGALTDGAGNQVKTFENAGADLAKTWESDILSEHAQATAANVYKNLQDPQAANEGLFRTEHFGLVDRGQDQTAHTIGYIDNLGQIAADPINSRVASYWHLPPAERNAAMKQWLDSPEGAKARRIIVDNDIRRVADPETGRHEFVDLSTFTEDRRIDIWLETATHEVSNILRAENQVGPIDQDLAFIVAHDRVPKLENVIGPDNKPSDEFRIAARQEARADTLQLVGNETVPRIGSTVTLTDLSEGVVTKLTDRVVSDPFNPGQTITQQIAEVQPVASGKAFTKVEKDPALLGTEALRGHIDYKGNQGLLSQKVRRANRIEVDKTAGLNKVHEMMDTGVKWFFRGLVGTAQYKLERSPLWRQAFYKEVAGNANLLSEAEQTLLRSNIDRYVTKLNTDLMAVKDKEGRVIKEAKITAEQYVGNKEIYNKIFGKVATGDATVVELEQYAGAVATREIQSILYDAHKKGNLEDMLRVIAPFASAFRETLGKYTQYLVEDPSRIRKAQLAYNGVNYNSEDPDNVGAGWFTKDPTSNTNVFNIPVGGWIGPLLQFPVRGAFQVLNLPGVGPVAQIAATELLPDTPKLDFVRNLVLPYGPKGISSLAPQWASRGIEAIKADTTNMGSIYGNTYADTVQYLAQSGSYNLQDVNDVTKLYRDAKNKARIMAGMRALFQFVGPTSPKIDFRLTTDNGDITAGALSQEFYKLQTKNRDTAVQEFIDTFGEDAFVYLGHKTEPTTSGIEPTKVFADWQRSNGGLFEQYKDVAGYLAPGGDGFSFQAWNRQINKGERVRLTADEILAGAQYKIGASIYRSKRNQMGDTLNAEQRGWLSQWRGYLNKQYPGFPVKAQFNPGELDKFIGDLRSITLDDRVQNNDTAQAISTYLDARDTAKQKLAEVGLSSFDSPRAQPLKDWLSSIAATLVQQTPEFSRVFEDKLAAEVD
jgi:hypothetical protein